MLHILMCGAKCQGGTLVSADFDPVLIAALQSARRITVLTGAGVSAESGIPTFRDELTGLWQNFDAHTLATADAFLGDPSLVWGWYEWRRSQVLAAQPNAAHRALAELARRVPQLSLFTQNVDNLHERAGSVDVQHLHGSLHHPRCFDCAHPFVLPDGIPEEPAGGWRVPAPKCQACGGLVRPGVVWFDEYLPADILDGAFNSSRSSDLLIVVGCSGKVDPAARLPRDAKKAGRKVIQINLVESALDGVCTWNLRGRAGELLPELIRQAF